MGKKSEIFLLFAIFSTLLISLVSAGNYGAETYGKGLYGIGEVPVVPPVTVAPSGGGGGGASCSYNWDCTDWFPAECPVTGIQERVCANRGTCTGTTGMPDEKMNCTYEHGEPLFDVFLEIPSQYEKVCAGNKINANVKLENIGKIELLDAFMTYWIIDKNNTLVTELKDTRNVAEKLDFDISIKIPELTPPGTYRLYAQITYSENKTAVAGQAFEVAEGDYCKISANLLRYLPFILIGAGFLILFILVIILYKKFHHHVKEKRVKVVRIEKRTRKKRKILFFKNLAESFRKLRRRMKQKTAERKESRQREERLRYQRKLRMRLFREKQIRLSKQRIARKKSEQERKRKYNKIVKRRKREERKMKNRLRLKRFVNLFRIKRKSPEEKAIKRKQKKIARLIRRKEKKRLKQERKKIKRIKKHEKKTRKIKKNKAKPQNYHHIREKIDEAFTSKRFGNIDVSNLRNEIREKGVDELEFHKKGKIKK